MTAIVDSATRGQPREIPCETSPPPLDPKAETWARQYCYDLYWQVMQGRYVPFDCVIQAKQLSSKSFRYRFGDGEGKRVAKSLEYYAKQRFSGQNRGLRKMQISEGSDGGCALTGNDRVHACLDGGELEIDTAAEEIVELSRIVLRVFQDADLPIARGRSGRPVKFFQFVKRSRNRRRRNAKRDRSDAAEILYDMLTHVIDASIALKQKKITPEDKSARIRKVQEQWKGTHAEVDGRIQRHARFEYTTGVFWGTLITIIVLAGLGFVAAHFGGVEMNGVHDTGSLTAATIGGTAGAFISVSQRLTRSTLLLDFTASRLQKMFLGTLRPAVGAVFGAFVYFAIIGGLLAIQSDQALASQNSAITLAFFAVAGFVSGFSERFAAGVLENAGSAVMPAPWGMQETSDRPR